ncbi:MAG: OsmC family peroxiredoxin [Calditrichaeota bacterium]|nr:MAG: OsmC family peroxiredoxin [Calditrichota bacterium]
MSDVVIKNVEGITFVGRGKTKHWVAIDGPETFGGSDAATRPMEYFLISLGGCTAADVASLLKKMRVNYDKFEVHVDAERAEEHPKVYTKIDLLYKLWGDDLESKKDKIEKAINSSQDKYCSISAMIRAADIPLNHTYELIDN